VNEFDWGLYSQAEARLRGFLREFLEGPGDGREIAARIERGTSTDIFEWIDHVRVPRARLDREALLREGFTETEVTDVGGSGNFRVKGSTLFPLIPGGNATLEVVLKTDDIETFRRVHAPKSEIEGKRGASVRRLRISETEGVALSAVERRGFGGFSSPGEDDVTEYSAVLRVMRARRRDFDTEREAFKSLDRFVERIQRDIESARLADAFFVAEREFWELKNQAARVQRKRQDGLGLGWGNRDHHTFRSSRQGFAALTRIFERLGMKPRERYHAGAQAGWGAQIMEHPESGEVVFADVDLGKDESRDDFARGGLGDKKELGTVGLWVALHGNSIFQAGMHHLAARFRFHDLTRDLGSKGIAMMKPFSDFPFLRQAFTAGEKWYPIPESASGLAASAQISAEKAAEFRGSGAIGSHLENIQRGQGFKGFNQDSVSAIIKATDPRTAGLRGA